jgi:hypothetical protein
MSHEAANAETDPTTVRQVEPSQPRPDPPDLIERARRLGPLPYSSLPGRRPAAVAVEPLAWWIADAIDDWWERLGAPDPFTVVEIGAGDGKRAAAMLARGPQCLTALRYVLVEDDAAERAQHSSRLPIESPILVLGPVGHPDGEDPEAEPGRPPPIAGIGPLITSLTEAPVVDGPAAVVATGAVGRLPSDRFEWREGSWWEVRLAATEAGGLVEMTLPMEPHQAAWADSLIGPDGRAEGARYARLGAAVAWLGQALRIAPEGWLSVVDRWSPVTRPLAVGEDPPVALDQLGSVRRPVEPAPAGLFSEISVLTWRLG